MNKKILNKILKHLISENSWFLYELHENNFFNLVLYNDFIKTIKELKWNKCIYNWELIYYLIDRLDLLNSYYTDLRLNLYNFNITDYEFFEYIQELSYEIKSLFRDDWELDFHWNKY